MDPMNPEAVELWVDGDNSVIDPDFPSEWEYGWVDNRHWDEYYAIEAEAYQYATYGRRWANVKDGMPIF